ncbi:MAG: peptidoglycan DD-metalloendopeptidase family protein [Acidimicrobiales bacterium]|nr:peptidoglycan DD-metalloendopeptidase family protein [Acidimicrobiales bacterium]
MRPRQRAAIPSLLSVLVLVCAVVTGLLPVGPPSTAGLGTSPAAAAAEGPDWAPWVGNSSSIYLTCSMGNPSSTGICDNYHPYPALDIYMPVGTKIVAAGAGTVSAVANDVGRGGLYVAVLHPNGYTSYYMHLSRQDVTVGQQVTRGQQLGLSGQTGNAVIPHLHYHEVLPGGGYVRVDPGPMQARHGDVVVTYPDVTGVTSWWQVPYGRVLRNDGSVVLPGAPTGVTAAPGSGQAVVTWTPPTSDGGAPITNYRVTVSPGGVVRDTGTATSATVTGLTNGTAYTFTVTATTAAGTGPASAPSPAVTPSTAYASGFHPRTPVRILDTRDGTGGFTTPFGPGVAREVQVTGTAVPAGASAVVMNVTVTGGTGASHLTVWPTGNALPTASNLNFVAGQTVPNLVVSKLSGTGRASIFNNAGNVHVIADVVGWFEPAATNPTGDGIVGVTPTRILDTRDGTGGQITPYGPGESRDLAVAGLAGVPANATAVVMNVTATGASAPTHLTIWPAGEGQPTASNLNLAAGQTVPNLVVAKLGVGGQVSVFNNAGDVDVLADVVGYYVEGGGGRYTPLVPARILDTRDGTGAPAGKLGAASSLHLEIAGRGGVPATGATAVVLNVTVTAPDAPSHLTVWPAHDAMPLASNLNFVAGQTVPNLVTLKLDTDGHAELFNNAGSTHVIADVVGWYG